MKKPKRTSTKLKHLSTNSNSKILHDTMVALGALKEQTKLNNLPIHEIQVHLLDDDEDGIVLCLEYDERTGEINKTFYNVDEYYETEHEDDNFEVELDPCISPENVKEFLRKRIEETISEEYDEIFHNGNGDNNDDEEPPPLLN